MVGNTQIVAPQPVVPASLSGLRIPVPTPSSVMVNRPSTRARPWPASVSDGPLDEPLTIVTPDQFGDDVPRLGERRKVVELIQDVLSITPVS